jgi:hypothetical protein
MDNQQRQTSLNQQSLKPSQGMGLTLSQDQDAKKGLAVELFQRFQTMKTYGKDPASMSSIVDIFIRDLSDYPVDLIQKAITTHAKKSTEFPTVADIVGLIERNGKPPLSEAMYISISRKDYEDRTQEENAYFRAYQKEQMAEWGENYTQSNPQYQDLVKDNQRLRTELREVIAENKRLGLLINKMKINKELPQKLVISQDDKAKKTLEYIKLNGASQEDVQKFANEYGLEC